MRFYLDTAIWIDFYEDRKGFSNEPLGEYVWKLLAFIISEEHMIILSDINMLELEKYYSLEEINGMFRPFEKAIIKAFHTKEDVAYAIRISKERRVPKGDVLHALISRNSSAILIARDNHFRLLIDISEYYKPEYFFSN